MIVPIYLIVLIIFIYDLIRHLKQKKETVLLVFKASYLLYYFVVPILMYVFRETVENVPKKTPYLETIINASIKEEIVALFVAILGYVVIIILQKYTFTIGEKCFENRRYYDFTDDCSLDFDLKVFRLGVVLTCIGTFGFLIMVSELGGVSNALSLGEMIRATVVDSSTYLSAVGMIGQTLSVFVTGGCICIFCSKQKKLSHYIIFLFSFIVSILYLVFNSGRSTLLVFIACFVFYYLKKANFKISILVIIAYLLLVMSSSSLEIVMVNIAKGRSLFFNLEYSLQNNVISTVSDLSYPYANLLNVSKLIKSIGYGFGAQYFTWIFEIMPQRFFNAVGISIPPYRIMTSEVSSYYIHNMSWKGGTPVDYITNGLLQLNILGMIINSIITIKIIRFIDGGLFNIHKKYYALLIRFCFLGYSFITSNDMTVLIYSNLYLFIIIIMIYRWRIQSTTIYN